MAKARKKSDEDNTAAASFVKGGGLVRHQKLSLSVDLSSRMISGHGGFRRLWGNKRKSLNSASKSTKDSNLQEKILCRVCFEWEISVFLLPCRHRVLCSNCSEKCKKRPICRASIEERLPVYDVYLI